MTPRTHPCFRRHLMLCSGGMHACKHDCNETPFVSCIIRLKDCSTSWCNQSYQARIHVFWNTCKVNTLIAQLQSSCLTQWLMSFMQDSGRDTLTIYTPTSGITPDNLTIHKDLTTFVYPPCVAVYQKETIREVSGEVGSFIYNINILFCNSKEERERLSRELLSLMEASLFS